MPDLRRQLGAIASRFHGDPSRRLDVVAITGTNGKTTVAYVLADALSGRGGAGYAGTLGTGLFPDIEAGVTTTPDPIGLQAFLSDLVACGARAAALEVSSHALVQHRITGTAVDVAVFTNLGHDHLDYHGTPAAYAAAKRSLFELEGLRRAVINVDDPVGRDIAATLAPGGPTRWTFGTRDMDGDHHVCLVDYAAGPERARLTIDTPDGRVVVSTSLYGDFNAENLLAALTAMLALDVRAGEAAQLLSGAQGAPGRMQRVDDGAGPRVIVDYAHTPDSLRRALAALRPATAGRLVCVFGCGGDRDATKRAPMGRAAETGADVVIVTSDNPRGESNDAIASAILGGMRRPDQALVIHDRAEAITHAITDAASDDCVLIAGKGHERTQDVGGRRIPFSDASIARAALDGRAT